MFPLVCSVCSFPIRPSQSKSSPVVVLQATPIREDKYALLTPTFSSIGPRIVQTDVVAVTAETEQDQKVVASNVANEATSSAIAEVAVAADPEAVTLAEATTPTIHAAVTTAAEALLAATTDATIAAATLQIVSKEETAVTVPAVGADLLPATTETEVRAPAITSATADVTALPIIGRAQVADLSAPTALVEAAKALLAASSEDQGQDLCVMVLPKDHLVPRVRKPSLIAEAIPKMATQRTTAILKNRMVTESSLLLPSQRRNQLKSQKLMETGTESESPQKLGRL